MKSPTRPHGLIVIIFVQVLAGLLSLIGGIVPSVFSVTPQMQGLGFLQFLAPVLSLVLIVFRRLRDHRALRSHSACGRHSGECPGVVVAVGRHHADRPQGSGI